jgi:hypothetical protein
MANGKTTQMNSRREKLWDWNTKLAVPLSQKEFDDVWKWIVDKHRRKRDKQHEDLREKQPAYRFDKSCTFNMYPENIKKSLEGNLWTEIGKNPIRWIIADKKMNVIYRAHQDNFEIAVSENGREEQKQRIYKLSIGDTKIKCIPISITKHESQLDFLQNQNQITYTATFIDTTGKRFTLARKTIDQIMEYLKNDGYIMPGYGATEALAAIITAFRDDGKLDIDKTINAMGLYWIKDNLVPVRLEEYLSANEELMSLPVEARQKLVKETVDFIEYLVQNFRAGVIPTALKIGVVSPADFALA